MEANVSNSSYVGGCFNTLAQSGTALKQNHTKPMVMVSGNGSDLTNEKLQRGRGKRKIITQVLALSLIKVAEEKGENELISSLWNTYNCQSKIYVSGTRAYTTYCKNRFCTVCLANRKADIIIRYLPELKTWKAPFFLTLTKTSVTAGLIKHQIKIMKKALRLIIGKYKKRNQRHKDKYIKLKGITSMECNFNPKKKTYNVHFHLILPNLKISDTIMTEWRLYWNNKDLVTKGAQCNKRIKKLNDGLIEVIKYGTKIFTVQDVKNKLKGKGKEKIYAAAFYNIVKAMREERIFERFGFNLPKADKTKIVKNKELTDYQEFEYNPQLFDWQNCTTRERLSKHLPSDELIKYLFSDRIDMETE